MSDRPALVEERPFEPLPQGLLIDTSVLGGIGTTGIFRGEEALAMMVEELDQL